jgi:hypothetical protein
MAGVRYIARRALAPSHVAGRTYFLPLEFTEAERERAVDKDVRRTLSGKTESRHHRTDTLWSLQFRPVQERDRVLLEEFLQSVQVGDTFAVFLYDDGQPLRVERIDNVHAWAEFMPTGERATDWMQVSAIQVREVDA